MVAVAVAVAAAAAAAEAEAVAETVAVAVTEAGWPHYHRDARGRCWRQQCVVSAGVMQCTLVFRVYHIDQSQLLQHEHFFCV